MRILAIERDNKACNHYRIYQPMLKLKELKLADTVLIEHGTQLDTEENLNLILQSDVILLPRASSEEWVNFVKAVHKAGKVLVSDYDDDPFNCSPWNPYYRWIGVEEWKYPWPNGKEEWVWKDGMTGPDGSEWFSIERNIHRRDMCRIAFGKSDIVTTTTPILANEFKKINPNTVVLPNLINFDEYPLVRTIKPRLRIGWQGGVSHYEDLFVIKKPLEIVCDRNDVEFVFFGDTRLSGPLRKIKNLKHEDWVAHNAYSLKLALLDFDINLCPLQDNHFNHCKSAIKWMESSAMKIPTIASNVSPYKEVITDGVDGLLVENTEEAWTDAIERLIKDPDLRKRLGENAYDNVRENHNADKKAHLWVDAYEAALKKDVVTV